MKKEFENMILSGPGQKKFERGLVEMERTKDYTRVPSGMGKLEGKVAIVTGAAGGQGEIEAKVLAQEGAKVVCVTRRNEAELNRVVEHIKKCGGEAIGVMADVSIEDNWTNIIVKEALAAFGRIDVLVNNAGVLDGGSVLNETKEAFDKVMSIDCFGVFFGMKHCAPEMAKVGGGAIVNTSSIYGAHFGPANCVAYATAKAAVVGMSRAAANDLADYGIRVNTIHPGHILTPMTQARPANRAKLAGAALQGRYGLCEELAKPVLFLCCDDSSHITGQMLYVDGGMTINLNTANKEYKSNILER